MAAIHNLYPILAAPASVMDHILPLSTRCAQALVYLTDLRMRVTQLSRARDSLHMERSPIAHLRPILGVVQVLLLPSHQLHQLVVDHLHQLLVWAHPLQDLHSQRLLLYALDKLPYYGQTHLHEVVGSALTPTQWPLKLLISRFEHSPPSALSFMLLTRHRLMGTLMSCSEW